MEKKSSSISSSKYISSTLENVSLNSNISLAQMKQLLNILDSATYALIIPILKIQHKINYKFSFFSNPYQEVKEKPDSENNENTTEDTKSENMNNAYEKNLEKMNAFCDSVKNNLELFTELSQSENYLNIIKAFNEMIPDNGMFFDHSRWYSLGGRHLPKPKTHNEEKDENDNDNENNNENGEEQEEEEDGQENNDNDNNNDETNNEDNEEENNNDNNTENNKTPIHMPHSNRLKEKLLNDLNNKKNTNKNNNNNSSNINSKKKPLKILITTYQKPKKRTAIKNQA